MIDTKADVVSSGDLEFQKYFFASRATTGIPFFANNSQNVLSKLVHPPSPEMKMKTGAELSTEAGMEMRGNSSILIGSVCCSDDSTFPPPGFFLIPELLTSALSIRVINNIARKIYLITHNSSIITPLLRFYNFSQSSRYLQQIIIMLIDEVFIVPVCHKLFLVFT